MESYEQFIYSSNNQNEYTYVTDSSFDLSYIKQGYGEDILMQGHINTLKLKDNILICFTNGEYVLVSKIDFVMFYFKKYNEFVTDNMPNNYEFELSPNNLFNIKVRLIYYLDCFNCIQSFINDNGECEDIFNLFDTYQMHSKMSDSEIILGIIDSNNSLYNFIGDGYYSDDDDKKEYDYEDLIVTTLSGDSYMRFFYKMKNFIYPDDDITNDDDDDITNDDNKYKQSFIDTCAYLTNYTIEKYVHEYKRTCFECDNGHTYFS